MTTTAKQIFEQAMALDEDDRAELVERLADTVEPIADSEHAAAWDKEIRERIAQVERGESIPIPWREAMEQIRRGEGDDE